MSLTTRFDALQRRHRVLSLPIAVLYKYVEDQGAYLAALIAYYGLLSILPLLLLLSTVVGFVLSGDPGARAAVLDSAVGRFPVIGAQLETDPTRIGGGNAGLVIGVLGAVYGALGVAQAVQNAMNTVWAVPRNERPNPVKARIRSLAIIGVAGVAVLAATVLSAAVGHADTFVGTHHLRWSHVVSGAFLLASVVLNATVFAVVFRHATTRSVQLRSVLPGALVAAAVYQLLQTFGTTYVTNVVRNASAVNSVFAVVLGLVAFLFVAASITVFGAEINVVRVDGLYPRALLTPFTDDVTLTRGDELAYTGGAKAARHKGFEHVEVSFDEEHRGG